MDFLQLDVVTPERRAVSERVDSVTVPGANGELGILPGHAPLISQLQTGILRYTQNGSAHQLLVSGGFVEVNHDRVSVLAEVAETPEEINVTAARAEREQLEKTFASFTGSDEEFNRLSVSLERAKTRLQLTETSPAIRAHQIG